MRVGIVKYNQFDWYIKYAIIKIAMVPVINAKDFVLFILRFFEIIKPR